MMLKILKVPFFALLAFILSLIGLFLILTLWLLSTTPDVNSLKQCLTTSMNQVRLCPSNSNYTKLNQLPPELIQAVMLSEDASFFDHNGFDWHELKASLSLNLRHRKFKRGGSTITQQLAKNVFLSPEKSVPRKLKEALLTYRLEKTFSKNEILEFYFNVVEFAPKIYGVRAASNYYFNTSPSQLNLLQAAFLAYLLPNPNSYSRVKDRGLTDFARDRILNICSRMLRFKRISRASYQLAKDHINLFPYSHLDQNQFRQTDFFPSSENVPDPDLIEEYEDLEDPEDDESSDKEANSEENPSANEDIQSEEGPVYDDFTESESGGEEIRNDLEPLESQEEPASEVQE